MCEFVSLRAEAEMFGRASADYVAKGRLYGWNLVIKRGAGRGRAFGALVVFRRSYAWSRPGETGPRQGQFFRQLRMGLDGQAFEMLKFVDESDVSPRRDRCGRNPMMIGAHPSSVPAADQFR